MALKVKAVERLVKFKKDDPGQYRYVMQPELYTALAQDKVIKEAAAGLISSRRIIFTPASDLKDELADTAIQITCFDRNGDEVKRVTSTDPGTVEDPESQNDSNTGTDIPPVINP